MPGKIEIAWFIHKTFHVISAIYKLFEYTFLLNCLEFSNKMTLPIQTRMFNKVKHRQTICLKFGDRIFNSIAFLGLEAKASICSTIEENLICWHLLSLS